MSGGDPTFDVVPFQPSSQWYGLDLARRQVLKVRFRGRAKQPGDAAENVIEEDKQEVPLNGLADDAYRHASTGRASHHSGMPPRAEITLLRHPLLTLSLFSRVVLDALHRATVYAVTHPLMAQVLVPLALLWVVLSFVDGPHTAVMVEIRTLLAFVVWWVGLGILSSVGLGTGMHSGLLFLFPHIVSVCLAASECGTLDFPSRQDMWFKDEPFADVCPESHDGSPVTLRGTFFKAFWPSFLWGAGTAMGELPPYWLSYAAKKAGQRLAELDDIMAPGDAAPSKWNIFGRMQAWMIGFLERNGFVGVLLMASWPNAAFDLCGICCGHFLMPFWTFFGATFIGKALIKVNLQVIFFVILFSDGPLAGVLKLIGSLDEMLQWNWDLREKAKILLEQQKHKFGKRGAHTPGQAGWMAWTFKCIMLLLIGAFAVSCVNQFAQQRAAEAELNQRQVLFDMDASEDVVDELPTIPEEPEEADEEDGA